MKLNIIHIPADDITEKQFEQMYEVETNSGGDPYSKNSLHEIVFYKNNDNFLCYNGETLVGQATLNPNSKRINGSVYLINISVHKDTQRQGIASKIMKNIIDYYKSVNTNKPFSLHVEQTNIKAINLYKKFGFIIVEKDDEDFLMSRPFDKNSEQIK